MYIVIILQNNEYARLECETLDEAQRVKVSFENYGRCDSVEIQHVSR